MQHIGRDFTGEKNHNAPKRHKVNMSYPAAASLGALALGFVYGSHRQDNELASFVSNAPRRHKINMGHLGYLTAAASLGAIALGFVYGSHRQDNELASFVSNAPRIIVTAPADGKDTCFYLETVNHSYALKYYFRTSAKENHGKLEMPDLDRDGYGCGKIGKRVD